MKNKFGIALNVVLIVAFVWRLSADDFAWSGGGTSGDWTDKGNWTTVSAHDYPVCGDTATFSGDVTITSDFDLGGATDTEEVLTVVIADGKKLTFDCSVSGNGGLARKGDGNIYLKKANPFKGKYLSYPASTKTVTKARTYVYDGGALGTNEANFDATEDDTVYTSVWFDAGGGTMNVTVPIKVSPCNNSSTAANAFTCRNGIIIFEKQVSGRKRFPFLETTSEVSDPATEIRFKEAVKTSNSGWFDFRFKNSTIVYFEKGYSISGSINANSSFEGTIHIGAPVTKLGSIYGNIVFDVEDAVKNVTRVYQNNISTFGWADNSTTSGSRVDLNGFPQHYPVKANGNVLTKTTNYGFTSPEGKPANVILEGAYETSPVFNGHFYGTAGLVWNPDSADYSFTFTNSLDNSSSGEMVVSNGTVRLAGGSSFTNLTRLAVSAGGTFAVVEGSGEDFFAGTVEAEAGAKLELGTGVTLATEKFKIGETEITDVGRYTAADYPDLIDGLGAVEIKGVPCTWTGADGGRWSDPGNWDIGKVPGAAHDVTIPAGKSVLLDETNPLVNSFTLGNGSTAATLTMTNWTTCLRAKTVTVLNKSVVTTPGTFTNETDKCRVWIQCTDFVLASGATISMDGKGWEGGHYNLNSTASNPSGDWKNCDGVNHGGWGPGRTGNTCAGASHLGRGGHSIFGETSQYLGDVYDDPYAPLEPGSGGYGLRASAYSQAKTAIGHGGGAVLIEAQRTVVLDGKILASGKGSSTHSYFNYGQYGSATTTAKNNQAGSGGAVCIRCSSISGSGEIHADGGRGGYGIGPAKYCAMGIDETGMPGGGGGVAILYDSTKQAKGAIAGMTISAAAGVFYSGGSTAWTTVDDYFHSSEPGTLYLADTNNLADTKLVDDTIGTGLSGRLFSLTNYTYEGDLDWTYGYVRFGATGVVFNVTGNLTLSGENARLDLGGSFVRIDKMIRTYVDAGDELVKLSVGGDLTVSDGALLGVYAAQVEDEATDWGAEVAVAGAFTVSTGGRVRPVSNPAYGGSPRFTAGSFVLGAEGKVVAEGCGGCGGWSSTTFDWPPARTGIGKGSAPSGNSTGSSHGGRGGKDLYDGTPSSSMPHEPVGNAYRPQLMGSGGTARGYDIGGLGGGVFHLTAAGSVQIDGEINVNGLCNETYSDALYFDYMASGSGGSIFLSGTTFAGAETARLSARGGLACLDQGKNKSGTTRITASGGGAGGRVALWFGQDKVAERHSERHSTNPADGRLQDGFANWHGVIDVGGGTNAVPWNSSYQMTAEDINEASWGEDGTITYNGAFDPAGVLLLIR